MSEKYEEVFIMSENTYETTQENTNTKFCKHCGEILDIAFEDLTYPLRSQLGQDFLYYDLKVYRLCPACREKLKDFHKNKKQEESEC